MVQWKKVRIQDIGTVVGGATPSTKIDANYKNGHISWITPKDLSTFEGRYIYTGERNITEMGLNSSSTVLMPKNSILFSSRAPIGYVAIAGKELCTNQGFKSVIPNKKIDYLFLYYLLKYNKNKIENLGSGTTFKEVSGSVMKNVEVMIPEDIKEQKRIAAVLNSIDDKIELNNEINDNLIQQGTSLFNEYLVKFDDVPNNWKVSSLDRIADYINGLTMQKYPPKDNEEGLPVLKIAELKQGCCDSNSDRCTSQLDEDYIINDGDVIFSWSASLVVDLWCGGKAGLNQHLFNVKSNIYDKWFYFWWTKYHLNEFIHEASSKATTMGHIKRDNLSKAKVLIPSKNDYESIGHLLKPITDSIVNVKLENKRLSALRDSLLPKLMSGEIDVDSIEL